MATTSFNHSSPTARWLSNNSLPQGAMTSRGPSGSIGLPASAEMGTSPAPTRRIISKKTARSPFRPSSKMGCASSSSMTPGAGRVRHQTARPGPGRGARTSSRAAPIALWTSCEIKNGSSPIDRPAPKIARQESSAPSASPLWARIAASAVKRRATVRAAPVSGRRVL